MDSSTEPVVKIFTKEEETEKSKSVLQFHDSSFEDGGEVVFSCSNCDKPLVVIWRTRPNEKLRNRPLKWNMKAACCYCGDYSFNKTITGGFHYKGYDQPHPNGNPEDVIVFVNVTDTEIQGNELVFKTEKKQ